MKGSSQAWASRGRSSGGHESKAACHIGSRILRKIYIRKIYSRISRRVYPHILFLNIAWLDMAQAASKSLKSSRSRYTLCSTALRSTAFSNRNHHENRTARHSRLSLPQKRHLAARRPQRRHRPQRQRQVQLIANAGTDFGFGLKGGSANIFLISWRYGVQLVWDGEAVPIEYFFALKFYNPPDSLQLSYSTVL